MTDGVKYIFYFILKIKSSQEKMKKSEAGWGIGLFVYMIGLSMTDSI